MHTDKDMSQNNSAEWRKSESKYLYNSIYWILQFCINNLITNNLIVIITHTYNSRRCRWWWQSAECPGIGWLGSFERLEGRMMENQGKGYALCVDCVWDGDSFTTVHRCQDALEIYGAHWTPVISQGSYQGQRTLGAAVSPSPLSATRKKRDNTYRFQRSY